jgi:type I restriction enzyme R subunit
MSNRFTESIIEETALEWLRDLGYSIVFGNDIAPEEPAAERENYGEVVLTGRLKDALKRINPNVPDEALEDAFRKVTRPTSVSLVGNNRAFHAMLTDGIEVEYRKDDRIVGDKVWLVDFEDIENNDWAAVNQFTIIENHINRRPDVIIFINGLPLAVIELKNAADEKATVWSAFKQLQTYKEQIPALFTFNEALLISDGVNARVGTLTANKERFVPWKTVTGEELAPRTAIELEVLLRGMFDKRRFLDLIRYFIVFEDNGNGQPIKKMAGYHQFHAVNMAIEQTVRAASAVGASHRLAQEERGTYKTSQPRDAKPGDHRIGVIWHTQGSGKSLTMAFYAGRMALHPDMQNPTIVVITDRNDLDDQLFGTFSRCMDLLRQSPIQADSRNDLARKLKSSASGGIIFTTIQKFLGNGEILSDRRNIVVIADEAHRSQYDFIDGNARAMRDALPNASFIGFTGTPIELKDANTRAVFGDYISVYDIQQAVEDGATVPIYYEGRLAKLELKEAEKPKIDPEFEEVTEGEEAEEKEKLKTKWAALESVVGSEKRVELIARDLFAHFDARLEVIESKAMIVCMSRRICVDMYNAIIKLRPAWHSEDDAQGAIKIVMTGSASDPLDWQIHIRNKERREKLANRFKDASDPFKIAIVRDMWLTGFDVPSLHTMYIDKPMQGHGLMQAIARVNRVYHDKPGGLIVDYLGLAYHLQQALAAYTESGGKGNTAVDQEQAVSVVLREYEICKDLFHLPAPPPSPYYVYAILCVDNSVYIGQTSNLTNRWQQHVQGTAAEWTKTHKPVRIAHYEPCASRDEAVRMEKEWKTGFGRKRIKRLIETGGARQAGGFDYSKWKSGNGKQQLSLLNWAQEHILKLENGKQRLMQTVTRLSQAFALAVPNEKVMAIRDDVGFFQAVRARIAKSSPEHQLDVEDIEQAIRQIISRAVASDEVIDIFTAAGFKKPDISILSDEFLADVQNMPQKNVAVELLRKLLNDEIKLRSRKNVVQSRSFLEMLERTIRAYQNRAIEVAEVVTELIELAKEMREANKRGEALNLTEDELAFYDALEVNDSAVKVIGDETLKDIARELVKSVRENATIDWTAKENVRAKLRVMVRRILKRYGYPPDKQEKATQTVLEQAEVIARDWAG